MTPTHSDAPICSNTLHMSPMLTCASICSRRFLHVIWRCGSLLLFGHPHVFGCLPMCPTPPCICLLPFISVCSRGFLHVLLGKYPICFGSGGVSTSVRLLVSVSKSIGCPLCFTLYLSCSSLCLKSLLPQLQLLLFQWLWCLLVCHLYHQWPWLPLIGLPTMFGQHDVVLLPPWHQDALEVLFDMPLCHSSNLLLWCPFRPMPIMPCVLHR